MESFGCGILRAGRGALIAAMMWGLGATWGAAAVTDSERADFENPPATARPLVWWHWMNGNITQQGITEDLEWMSRVGIGGLQAFDANLNTPQIVDERLIYMTDAWKAAFRHAVELADQKGLQFTIASSAGWSETGGPWVKPEDGIKKLVWSEVLVPGGKPFHGVLPPVPSATGPYQSMTPALAFDVQLHAGARKAPPSYSADVAVLAYPVTEPPLPVAKVYLNDVAIDGSPLIDGNFDSVVEIARGTAAAPAVLRLEYPQASTVRSATLLMRGIATGPFAAPGVQPRLEASDDGRSWRLVARFQPDSIPTTMSFAPVTARHFRLVLAPAPAPSNAGRPPGFGGAPGVDVAGMMKSMMPNGIPAAPVTDAIAQFELSAEPKVDRFEDKAGFAIVRDYYALEAATASDTVGVAPERVIDLTSRMQPDGSLEWRPPAGSWRVVRFGYSLTGKTNHPATDEATGLEVDKLDAAAVRRYLETYLGLYRDAVGPALMGQHGIRALLTDSTEVHAFNWTPRFIEQFRRLRNYDPTPWLPALAGALIGSRRQSDAFLYDFRRTLAELHASEHYGTVAAVAHEQGLQVYGEALESNRPSLGDDMAMRSYTDVPMSAMWTYGRDTGPRPTFVADVKGAASVAHVYGQNLVAAESMTSVLSPWAFAPSDLKRIMDLEFLLGVNRPVIHSSVHQPVDDKLPGLTLAIFGQYFNRHDTWAQMARPWIDYLARSAWLLQQGRYVADIAYFYGEEAPLTGLYGDKPVTDAPVSSGYDFVNSDVLLHLLSVDGGELVTKSGARYRALYLGGSSRKMTLAVLRRVAELADAGATVIGEAPEGSPSLGEDGPAYGDLVRRLWSGAPVTTVGHGRVLASRNVEAALAAIGTAPDFQILEPGGNGAVSFLHRRLADGDLYFLSNRSDRGQQVDARFRVTGKAPQIWHADTGVIEPVSYRTEGAQTVVPLDMLPDEAYFVVFREPAAGPSRNVAHPSFAAVAQLDGSWEVAFQPGRGAPAAAHLAALAPLNEQENPGIRYFSGTATYSKEFRLPKGVEAGSTLLLDLGRIGDVAEVRVNDKPVGTTWHAPYRLNIGGAVRRGKNRLEIRVADLWVNRLIGDAQPGSTPITWTPTPTYAAAAPLRAAGLIGPVRLLREIQK